MPQTHIHEQISNGIDKQAVSEETIERMVEKHRS